MLPRAAAAYLACLLALNGCTSSPPASPVCAFTVVAVSSAPVGPSNRNGTTLTGFKQGPINGGTVTGPIASGALAPAVGEDVSEVTVPPISTVLRLVAANFTSPVPRLAQVATGPGLWRTITPPTRAGLRKWTRVSATNLGSEINGCYVEEAGRAFLARPTNIGWSTGDIELWGTEPHQLGPLEDPNAPEIPGAGRVGPFADISCAGAEAGPFPNVPPTDLHVCAVATDGRLWHTIFNGSGWIPFADVQRLTSNNGSVEAVACAIEGRQLHVVALVVRAGAWFVDHAIRAPGGNWRPWQPLQFDSSGQPALAGSNLRIHDVAANFCEAQGPMPGGPVEARRLNVAWTTDMELTIIERSRGVVQWTSNRAGSVSPALVLSSALPMRRVSIAQFPFTP